MNKKVLSILLATTLIFNAFPSKIYANDTKKIIYHNNGETKVSMYSVGEPIKDFYRPLKEGYTFSGWYTDPATTIKFNYDKSKNEDINIYAKWIKDEVSDKYDILVDGSLTQDNASKNEYKTLQGAVLALENIDTTTTPVTIGIKEGVYDLNSEANSNKAGVIINKPNVTLLGLNGDRNKTVICDKRGNIASNGNGATVQVGKDGINFKAENITFLNYHSTDYVYPDNESLNIKKYSDVGEPQGEALDILATDKAIIKNCQILGKLDTFHSNTKRMYIEDTVIEGTADFIYGSLGAVFKNCTISFADGLYGPSMAGEVKDSGIGQNYFNCDFVSNRGIILAPRGYVRMALINCTIPFESESNKNVWYKELSKTPNYYFLTYNLQYADDTPATLSDSQYLEQVLTEEQVKAFNPYNILKGLGDLKEENIDNWNPLNFTEKEISEFSSAPTYLKFQSVEQISLNGSENQKSVDVSVQSNDLSENFDSITWSSTGDLSLSEQNNKNVLITSTKTNDEKELNTVTATNKTGIKANLYVENNPPLTDAPTFTENPTITQKDIFYVNYKFLIPDGRENNSLVTVYRADDENGLNKTSISVSRGNLPIDRYVATVDDLGKYIAFGVSPKTDRSKAGEEVLTSWVKVESLTTTDYYTDFRNFVAPNNLDTKENTYTIGYKTPSKSVDPLDVYTFEDAKAEVDAFAPIKTNELYQDIGNQTLTNDFGLTQQQLGSFIFHNGEKNNNDYQKITFNLMPSKTGGQGFGGAGQFIEIYIKSELDETTKGIKNGYAVHFARSATGNTTEYWLVKYENSVPTRITDISEPTKVFRPNSVVSLEFDKGLLTFNIESNFVTKDGSVVEEKPLTISTDVASNDLTGFGIMIASTPGTPSVPKTAGYGNAVSLNSMYVENERALEVPLRKSLDIVGVPLSYNQSNKTATFTLDDKTYNIKAGEKVEGFDFIPTLKDNKIYVSKDFMKQLLRLKF